MNQKHTQEFVNGAIVRKQNTRCSKASQTLCCPFSIIARHFCMIRGCVSTFMPMILVHQFSVNKSNICSSLISHVHWAKSTCRIPIAVGSCGCTKSYDNTNIAVGQPWFSIFIYPNLADNMTSLLDLPFFSAYWYHSISPPYQISGVFGWYTVIFVPRCGFSHIPIFWWMSSPQMALTKYGVCADGETFWTTGIWWFPFLHCERSAARYFAASRPAKNQAQNHLTPFLVPDKKPVFFLDHMKIPEKIDLNYIHI